MKNYRQYFFIFLIAFGGILFCSCSKDFNPNADYKDITIVYGLVDVSDSITSFKIVKAFTVDENVYTLAKDSSENIYGDYLTVDLIEYTGTWNEQTEVYTNKNPTGVTIRFNREYIYNKEDGTFYNPAQVVYQAVTKDKLKLSSGGTTYLYSLRIVNNNTGEEVTSEQPVALTTPMKNSEVYPASDAILNIKNNSSFKQSFDWVSLHNGRRYEPKIRFFYTEKVNGADSLKYEEFKLGTFFANKLTGGVKMRTQITGSAFYSMIQSRFSTMPVVPRTAVSVQYIITAGADDISNYIELNKPSNTIVQQRPEYTNIVNGYGIFSSTTDNLSGPAYRMLSMDPVMLTELHNLNIGF